jgi:hypothetical protein
VTSREELDAAARRVVADHLKHGTPYVLYLRHYGFDVLHGPDDASRQLTENYLLNNLGRGINLLTVQEHDAALGYGTAASAFARRAPAFFFDDSEWLAGIRRLIIHADLVFSECLFLSGGVRAELDFAYHNGAYDRTVLVLPPPSSMVATVDDDELVQMFPRVVYASEFFTRELLDSFAVRDLLDRVRAIAGLSKRERRRLVDPGERRRRYPVTWDGVASGYMATAAIQELAGEDGETESGWHHAFWSYFRAGAIHGLRLQAGQVTLQDVAPALVECYLSMGRLMLRSEERDGRIVLRGDLPFARQCAKSAQALVDRAGLSLFEPLVEGLVHDLEQYERAARLGPDRVIVEPRIKPIKTKRSTT